MKKIFTFIAALAVAASVNAQQLYINGDAPVDTNGISLA